MVLTRGQKISIALKGRKLTTQHKLNISKGGKGIKKGVGKFGKLHNSWKGKKAGYRAKHIYVIRFKGKAKHCSICKTTDKNKKYEYHNIDKKYSRNLKDYIPVCKDCHRKIHQNI